MRFIVTLDGETSEPTETHEEIRGLIRAFGEQMTRRGYSVVGCGLEFPEDPPCADCPEDAEMLVVPEGAVDLSATVEPGTVEVLPTLREKIDMLQRAASNAHMSQRELSEALGVSRYQIKKALKG